MAEMKTAAYICSGCGIGERVSTAQMAKIAQKEGKMALVREHACLCDASGVQTIKDDIEKEAVTHIVIAACSRRAKTEAFNFPSVAMSRANIREGVIWSQPEGDDSAETTQEMADDYVRMGCAEVKKMKVPEGNPNRASNKRILVVGGGVSGMTAALEMADAGYDTVLVEKSGALGGWAAELVKRVPSKQPYADPAETGIAELAAKVSSHKHIKLHLNSTIAQTNGAPGRFAVDIAQESGATVTEEVGALIQATGFTPYDMMKLPELGAGKSPNVVDQLGLEKLVKAANGSPVRRPSDGGEVKSVVFIQCAGQRDEAMESGGKHLPYCSGHCCATSIKQAMYFKDANPDIDTMVMYTDLRVPGTGEDFYRSGQQKGITFTKGKTASVEAAGNACKVNFKDLILNEDVTVEADLVVLATGMVANSGMNIDVPEEEVAKMEVKPISILNLNYRQGKDMPQLKNGFADSHFICFPYETRRTGIYTCGPVRRPMDMGESAEDAAGAVLKAIQAIENSKVGVSVHPRAGDLTYPKIGHDKCTKCRRCTVECPFGAIDEDEQGRPTVNFSRCRRCGTCMGACPVQTITFDNYNPQMVNTMIEACEIPDEFSEKPRMLILACENDAYPAIDMAGIGRHQWSPFVRIIPVRCLGSVTLQWISTALQKGYDGIMLMGCKSGDDYQCHFIKGSAIAKERMSKVGDTLKSLALEKERVTMAEVSIADSHSVVKVINDFAETIGALSPNPMKGF